MAAAKAPARSTEVVKAIPLTLDLGNFAAFDPQPVDRASLRSAYVARPAWPAA